ncbi:LacI family DNA-binding transcriptional regulator [Curtobacterium sp. MCBD17_003]|uniref:LacI family DNA-binding transcriptional regulator n=1 Tax=Curtobacterium sp. MCBD17_003 TaxID=2175667 RepID=UPI000DA84658|nr:LacI family DNA-binding transcriptional regulator [Curtobacterium sp. MCBD17_003]WIE55936.1 LacI family DNA-binding transcriptional regulator [Curtobacterium sp. MCBD17_003]
MKAPTIYDVARLAGVSHQTVSRYLSGFEGIRPETRTKVKTALDELQYRPNSAARLLRARRSNRIAVLAHHIDYTGPARMLAGATQTAQERGYVLDVVITADLDRDAIDEALAVATGHQVVGILATAQTELMLERIQSHAASVPVVIDSRIESFPGGPTVSEEAGRLAAEHLLELGHRRVGYLSGPVDWIAAVERSEGFARCFRQGGGELVWQHAGDWSAGSGHAAWRRLTAEERSVTAIATGNDSMAIGLLSAAAADGVVVPADLSVMGGDDLDEARYLVPALTTVTVDFAGEGRYLIEKLLAGLPGAAPDAPVTPPNPVRAAVRTSTRRI